MTTLLPMSALWITSPLCCISSFKNLESDLAKLVKSVDIRLVKPDQYKSKKMCDDVILENDGMFKFVPDC